MQPARKLSSNQVRADRPSIRQLEALVAIAERGGFRKAATELGITQPALSAQIRAVEDLLGVQVFERDRRAVLVTPAGEEVVGRARVALEAIDAVRDAARRRGEPLVGPLRLGVIPTVAPWWLPALLPEVRKRFPRLELILREDQTARLLGMLDAGLLDVAFLAIPVPGDLTTVAITEEEFVLAAPRGAEITKKRGKLVERDLEDQIVLLLEDGHCLRDQALAVCERGKATTSLEVRATSLPTLEQMVAGGMGVTLLPLAAAVALVPPSRRGPVTLTRFQSPEPGRTLGLAWRSSSARYREFRLLADTLESEAKKVIAKLRPRV